MKPLAITNSITIKSSAEKVWDLLVNPEQTKKYMFGCETVSGWKPGDDLLWRGEWEGKEMIFVKGKIIRIESNRFLEYTVIDPLNPNIPDLPENYLNVTYSLSEEGKETKLTVTQGDYNKVAEGENRYKDSYNNGEGWNPILIQIKKLAEEQ